MSALPMPRRVADNGPRAFDVMSEIPIGGFTVNIDCDMHWPHLRRGEVAIVDAQEREIEWGELYAMQQSNGPTIWQVCRNHWGDEPDSRPCAFLHPLNRPRPLPDGGPDLSGGMLYASEGPIYLDALMGRLLGRVIGIFNEPTYDPKTGAKLPTEHRAFPVIRPEDEMKWRYLAFLQQERDALANELGALSQLGIYTLADRSVNRFFSPSMRDEGRHQRPGNRAEAMLETAGIISRPIPIGSD